MIVQPIQHLDGKPQRCIGQTCDGEPTYIEWTGRRIVFPTINGAAGSGAILCAHGLLAGTLGMKHKRPGGRQQRPDFCLIDDPQTRQSALTPSQVSKRLAVIKASILKMAGHRQSLAVVVNATVIAAGDLADQLLDHKQNAAWQSERIPMVRSWATAHETLWLGQYAEIRRGFNPELPGDQQRAHRAANEFYQQHRAEMDAGCAISWEHCYVEDAGDGNMVPELSAIQHAYNSLIDDGPEVFASECQCQPLKPETLSTNVISKELLATKITATPRDHVPQACERITAAIDVGRVLWWSVVGWKSDFTGHVLNYGCYPTQPGTYWTNAGAKTTIRQQHPGMGEEAALRAALEQLSTSLISYAWKRSDGTAMRIERIVVDSGFQTDVIYSWLESSAHGALVVPSIGRFFGATSRTVLSEYKTEPGERRGLNFLYTRGRTKKKTMHLIVDANASKTFLTRRLESAVGDSGSLTFFNDPARHEMLFDHLTAEQCELVKTTSRTAEEWTLSPGRDNHLFDCLSLNCIAASFQGCQLGGIGMAEPMKKPRLKMSDMQKAKRASHGEAHGRRTW